LLELEIQRQRFLHILPDQQLVQILEIRQSFEKQDALDQLVRRLHLVDRLVVLVPCEALESPVAEHPRMQKILIDRGELVGEHRIQMTDDVRIAAHALTPWPESIFPSGSLAYRDGAGVSG